MSSSIEIGGMTRHPFEQELADVVQVQLQRNNWPANLLDVTIGWKVKKQWFGEHDISKVKLVEGRPSGEVKLLFNYVYLVQRPDKLISLAVPHLLAHAYADLGRLRKNKPVPKQPHDAVFTNWLYKFSDVAPKKHTEINVWFDDRPFKLWKGGVLVRCRCEGEGAYTVAYGREEKSKLVAGDWICERCQVAYERVPRDEMPAGVAKDLDYLSEEACHR